jgi:hypothetical protein
MILRTLMVSLFILSAARGAAPANEEELVRIAALRFMMKKHAEFGNERQHYSLYVLRVPEYVKHFEGFQPPVVAFEEGRYPTSSGQAIDAKTGKRVKIWSIGGQKIEGERATVGISWHTGRLGAGLHTISLRKREGIWIVESERTDGLSSVGPDKRLELTSGQRPDVAHL